MKCIFLVVLVALSISATSQVVKVSLQASGLTCSMCSNAINKALRTLDFIDKVYADVKTYTFDITFKTNGNVDFDRIKKKVEDAGFSVSGFVAAIYFNNVLAKKDQPFVTGDKTFLLINAADQVLDGLKEVSIKNKGFVSLKEFKQNDFPVSPSGTYYASIN